jgi:hypothetical protein
MIYKKFMRAGGSVALIFSGFTFSLEAQNPTEEDKRNNVTQPAPATPAPAPDAIPVRLPARTRWWPRVRPRPSRSRSTTGTTVAR